MTRSLGLYAARIIGTRDIAGGPSRRGLRLKVSADLVTRHRCRSGRSIRLQERLWSRMYPCFPLCSSGFKIRDAESRQVKNKAVYVALGVTLRRT